jgi:hypothetical protein
VAERRGPTGVGEHGTYIMGSSRNLGGPVVSVESRFWESGKQSRARGGCALTPRERTKVQRRYREAKETKRHGKGGRESECFIVCAEQRIVREG